MSTLREAAQAVVDRWASDESVQFVSRSDGQRTTATVSKNALLLLAECAMRAELAKPDAPMVQDGWQLVPVVPTMEMVEAARDVKRRRLLRAVEDTKAGREPNTMGAAMACDEEWRAMLAAAAAPRPAPAEPQPTCGERDRYEFVLAQCREAQDIAASRGWALNDIATASTTDPRARKIATEALLSAPSQPAAQQSKPLLEWQKAVMEAYGHLWHVNNEPAAPIPMRSPEKAAYEARIFELEQRNARLEAYVMQQEVRIGDLVGCVQKLKDLNSEMFVSRCQAHAAAEEAEQDAARFRMLLQQHKHWLGVFRCDPDGAPSDSLDHVELKALLDQLIAREPAPDCKTPVGCAENGCLGWCDEHKPEAATP